MVHKYEGHYTYSYDVVHRWNSKAIGVYYCGHVNTDKKLVIHYIGKGVGEEGIRGRLLDHLREDTWPGVTHFGYQLCDYVSDAEKWEREEIQKYKPKYNTVGV